MQINPLVKIMANNQLNRNDPVYTLGIAARLSNTPQHSIRQYIDKGLIIPYRTKTNRHLFSEVDLLRLQEIRIYLDEKGLNIAGIKALFSIIPCWKLKPCTAKARENCEAYHSSGFPCWEASQKGPECRNSDCRTCKVYQLSTDCRNLKFLVSNVNANN